MNTSTLPDINKLKEIVVASSAEELLPRFAQAEQSAKPDGSIVTQADLAMQNRVREALAEHWPQFPLLGEEMDKLEQIRLLSASEHGLWCLDPLDGTSNFTAGLPFFSVSLALLMQGRPVLGLVYDPIRQECFTGIAGEGAWLNGRKLTVKTSRVPLNRTIAAVDFKRLPGKLAKKIVAHPPYLSQRSFGSVALDWCWLAASRYHVYLHGRQNIWDYAAGCLILREAGGHAQTLQGEPVFIPDIQPRSAVAALEETLFREWCAWIAD
jgi:myo-inositol-1(or 4)-monophosphatase